MRCLYNAVSIVATLYTHILDVLARLTSTRTYLYEYNRIQFTIDYVCVCRDMGHRSSYKRTQKMEGINSGVRYLCSVGTVVSTFEGKKVA
jgi:hypothetical protein